MTTRFEYIVELGILPYLHFPELPALNETSEEIHRLSCNEQLTFYGIPLPTSDDNFIIQDLFNKNYASFEQRLLAKEDQHVESPYSSRNPDGQWIPSTYRATFYNKRWNKYNLMELVYMLGDFTAYQLLKKYERTSANKISDWSTTYVDNAVMMLELHGEEKKKEKILLLRPEYDRVVGKANQALPF